MLGLIGFGGILPTLAAAAEERVLLPLKHGGAWRLNAVGYQHAIQLIAKGRAVADNRGDWGLHRPTAADQGAFIDQHGYAEFGTWCLAVNDATGLETRRHWAYPFGDFQTVRRSALIAAQSRAREWGHTEVEAAAGRLLAMVETRTPG